MTHAHGTAGQSTREMTQNRYRWALLASILAVAILLALGLVIQEAYALRLGGAASLVLLILLCLVPDLADRRIGRTLAAGGRAARGAQAEEEVGRLLETLGEDFYVLHDVRSPYGNIDHLVFGRRSGPFLIETKSHHGKVEFDGDRLRINRRPPEKDFFAQTLRNTYWLREELAKVIGLTPWVTPILVFTNAFVPRGRPIRGVTVVNKKYLLQTIRAGHEGLGLSTRLWNCLDKVTENLCSSGG
ncbi:MAG: nuclease-related domain-containing protein [Anaerolineales bacterium]